MVISDEIAAVVTVARVGDEVTNALVKQSSSAVTEDGEVSFFYEIAERVLVLSNHLRDTRDVGFNNLEIKGDGHS